MTGREYRVGDEVEVFAYPACPGVPPVLAWNGLMEFREAAATEAARPGVNAERATKGAEPPSERLEEERRKAFEAGRECGLEEGRKLERAAHSATANGVEERYKRQLGALVERFAVERDRYLHAVEREVVKLALAVAARILRREAQMDPLLLLGAARVALGQLAGSSEVRLRVPPAELELWKEAIALLPNLTLKPQVVAGEGMRLGDCVIESQAGSVDLGVRSQLGEIERGFFDRTVMAAQGKVGAGQPEAPTSTQEAAAEVLA